MLYELRFCQSNPLSLNRLKDRLKQMNHVRIQLLHVQIIATDLPLMMLIQTIKYRLYNLHLSGLQHPN